MVTIAFISSMQNRRRHITYQYNIQKCYVSVKTNISFQLQQQPCAIFHIQKLYCILFLSSNKLLLSDNQEKNLFP